MIASVSEWFDRVTHIKLLGNDFVQWGQALLVLCLSYAALTIIKRAVSARLKSFAAKTDTRLDDFFVEIINKTRFFFLFALSLYPASHALLLPNRALAIIHSAVVVAVFLQIGLWSNTVISFWVEKIISAKAKDDPSSATAIAALTFIGKLAVWSLVVLLSLDNVGIQVTALLAGLGVGGIAIALAVQNVLGDLFASLSIVLDKPFVIGDFIIVGDLSGTVEHVGLKTTRVRSLSGEQLIFANSDLLSSRIRNFKRMFERRVVFKLGVVYQTPHEMLARIPSIIKEIVQAQPQTRFDRAHFASYGDFALLYEIVYYVLNPDYNFYMDVQHAINLEIYRRFAAEKIEFAYPTQTLFVVKQQPT